MVFVIVNMAIYNGEFARKNEKKEKKALPKAKTESLKAAPFKQEKEKTAVSKKRGKKLAWKRRQMEQKLHRIETKNTSTNEKEEQD